MTFKLWGYLLDSTVRKICGIFSETATQNHHTLGLVESKPYSNLNENPPAAR